MILLKKIEIKNFLSHKETYLEFSPNEKILLDGVSGSGKSSVVEAILWAIYGEGRTNNRDLVRRGAKSGEVALTITDKEGREVKIMRSISSSGKHDLSVLLRKGKNWTAHEISGVKALQHWIEHTLMGASRALFVNSIAYTQSGEDLFVSQPANRRKDLLLEIIKAEDYDTYYEMAKEKIQAKEVEMNGFSSQIGSQSSFVLGLMVSVSKKKELTAKIVQLEKDIDTQKKVVSAAHDASHRLSELLRAEYDLKTDISSAKAQIERIEASEAEWATRQIRIDLEKKSLETLQASLLELQEKSLVEEEKEKKREEVLLKRPVKEEDILRTLPDRILIQKKHISHLTDTRQCPSGDLCPFIHERNTSLASAALEIAKLEIELSASQKIVDTWKEEHEALDHSRDVTIIQKYHSTKAEIAHKEAQLNELEGGGRMTASKTEKSLLEKTLIELEKKALDIEKERESIGVVSNLQNLQNDLLLQSTTLAKLQQEFTQIEENEALIHTLQEDIAKNKKLLETMEAEVEKLYLIKEAFGSKGIRSVVIDYMIPHLEEKVNQVLSRLSEFTVRFDTQAQKTDGGTKEGLYIFIQNDVGEELPWESYSGGEKLRISFAITEGIASLLNNTIGFRIIDEAIHSMNPEMTSDFISVVDRLLQDYSQVIVISHLDEVKEVLDKKILITKHNGVSTLN
jgi:DNA repair exonuclease SbcCD ATPase subunit